MKMFLLSRIGHASWACQLQPDQMWCWNWLPPGMYPWTVYIGNQVHCSAVLGYESHVQHTEHVTLNQYIDDAVM